MTNEQVRKAPATSVAVVCLDGAVSMYADTMSFVAWKLQHNGMNILRLGCDGVLETCTSVNSTGKPELTSVERSIVCRRCRAAQQRIATQAVICADHNDTAHDDAGSKFLSELKDRLESSRTVSDVLDMSYRGYPLCRIAFFDFAIVTKLAPDTTLDPYSIKRFVSGVRDLITLLTTFERVAKAHKLSHVVYVNGNYTQNTLARTYFRQRDIVCLSIEPQLTSQHILSRITMVPERLILDPDGLYPRLAGTLTPVSGSMKDATSVLKNFGARIRGADFNAYTSLNDGAIDQNEADRLRKFLSRHKRIHSFFLSSQDELTPHIVSHGAPLISDASPLGNFKTQPEFTKYLLTLAAKCPEVGFVIRLHPRMAANKRDPFESNEHLQYKELLRHEHIPKNVLILLGDSKVSSYYVIRKSDLAIVSWSTIGLEALLLGVPVVAVFPGYLMYPIAQFASQPATQDELEATLMGEMQPRKPDDRALIAWMSVAFEGQFFATAAPRGQGGLHGKLYRLLYRVIRHVAPAYRVLAATINLLLLRNVKNSHAVLLRVDRRRFVARGAQLDKLADLLRNYRQINRRVLNRYERRIASRR